MRLLEDRIIENALRCPHCGEALAVDSTGSGSLACHGARRHCFDFASSGYVNLALPGQSAGGDAKAAVRARSDFLNKGYYAPVADALCRVLTEQMGETRGLLVDAGCGEGYYTDRLAACGFSTVGVDLSKFAAEAGAKRSAREHRNRSFFAVGSVFSLPLMDACAQAVVNVFAPCAEAEYARVLQADGVLAVVHAGPDHLMGLKRALYDKPRTNEGRADLPQEMVCVREERIRYEICVQGRETIETLFAMTPYYWKTSPSDGEKLRRLETLVTEVDMILSLYQKRQKERV